ncbi:SecY-interacting protein [Celerinatantimonas diazotrophica]|nr:SecY-interacting protein [Celerinatantimonas diazotrophica]
MNEQQNTVDALDQLISQAEQYWQQVGYPQVEYDAQWPSPCQCSDVVHNRVYWHPVLREKPLDLSATEDALDLSFHPSVKVFYSRYYSETMIVRFNQQKFALVQVWNDDDGVRLQENLIAHILMKRRLKHPETLFIASAEDEMQIVSVVNQTGEVILETLGKKQDKLLASSLGEFLSQLKVTS